MLQISFIHGEPYNGAPRQAPIELTARADNPSHSLTSASLVITVTRSDTGAAIVPGTVPLDRNGTEINFALDKFTPSLKPYTIKLVAEDSNGHSYSAETQLYRLPDPPDSRSVTKIDNLHSALLVLKDGKWVPFFPYSFYLGSGEIGPDPSNLAKFAHNGYNVLHVIPGYDYDWFDKVADEAEKLGMWIMYDMRHTYQSEEDVKLQVERYAKRKNLLLWYTADEPGRIILHRRVKLG